MYSKAGEAFNLNAHVVPAGVVRSTEELVAPRSDVSLVLWPDWRLISGVRPRDLRWARPVREEERVVDGGNRLSVDVVANAKVRIDAGGLAGVPRLCHDAVRRSGRQVVLEHGLFNALVEVRLLQGDADGFHSRGGRWDGSVRRRGRCPVRRRSSAQQERQGDDGGGGAHRGGRNAALFRS